MFLEHRFGDEGPMLLFRIGLQLFKLNEAKILAAPTMGDLAQILSSGMMPKVSERASFVKKAYKG